MSEYAMAHALKKQRQEACAKFFARFRLKHQRDRQENVAQPSRLCFGCVATEGKGVPFHPLWAPQRVMKGCAIQEVLTLENLSKRRSKMRCGGA